MFKRLWFASAAILIASLLFLGSFEVFAAVNVNTATAEEMTKELNGIGDKKANAIVEYRETHGKFKNFNDFDNVPGIGVKLIERNKDNIVFTDEPIPVSPTETTDLPKQSE